MTGDEILDSGVQVMAQPPGKKNQTIHLLSGGEKALTAIALVFAIFQLNPAPFCLLDEVDAPLDDANTERYAKLVTSMSRDTQFLFISHNKIAMEMAEQLIGVTMQEQGVSRIVAVDMESAVSMAEAAEDDEHFTVGLAIAGRVVLAVLVAWNAGPRAATRRGQAEGRAGCAARRTGRGAADPVFDAAPPLPLPEKKPGPRCADRRAGADRAGGAGLRRSGAGRHAAHAAGRQQAVRHRRPQRTRTQHWEMPHPGQRYGAFQAGVQLANRTGALNEIEYSEFVMKVQAFADAVNGAPDFPEMLDEVARAARTRPVRQRPRRAAELHAARPEAAWSPGYVQQNAARLGFVAGAMPGRMVLPAARPGRRRCWACRSTPRPRWPTIRTSRRCAS